jgi:hypothetical protein
MVMGLSRRGSADRLSLLDRRLAWTFSLRLTVIAPGGTRTYDEAEWRDALVVIERGEIELVSQLGSRLRLECGAVLWLSGLPISAIHNPGAEPALLVAVARRARGHGPRRHG